MRSVYALWLVCVACGPGIKPKDPKVASSDAMTSAAKDVAAMTRLVRGSVVNGGLWFDDATCARFAPGEVARDSLGEFARCLVGLGLTKSPRSDALGDVVVMTYAPGFEVQARVVNEPDGPRLAWIGFASRSEGDALPTISASTLESSRDGGSPDGPVPVEVARALDAEPLPRMVTIGGKSQPWTTRFQFTWVKVCIDESGSVSNVTPYETTALAHQQAVVDVAKTWHFKPFTVQGQPVPVCAMSRVEYPLGSAPQPEELPLPLPPRRAKRPPVVFSQSAGGKLLEGRRVFGTKAIVPDDSDKRRINGKLVGSFRLCIDEEGTVDWVLPLQSTGVAGYDAKLLAGIRSWKYSPYKIDDVAIPVCTRVTFIYSQR